VNNLDPRRLWIIVLVLGVILIGIIPSAPVIGGLVAVIGLGMYGVARFSLSAGGSPARAVGRGGQASDNASARALEDGGLPAAAQERLRALAGNAPGFFTSDLSVNEFALLRKEGIVPVTQVMGSSIFKHGWRNLPGGYGGYGGYRSGAWTAEVTALSDAFNGSRARALDRLTQEATLAGADAVVGVRLNAQGHDWAGAGTVEFTAVGTAVRLPETLKTGAVVITDLSGQEYWQLAQEGVRPVGVVGITTVMYVASGYAQNQILRSGNSFLSLAGRANQEIGDFTQGFYEAREVAMSHLQAQASSLGAHGIVGVQIATEMREREWEDSNDNSHHDLIVNVHLLGTAITEGHPPLQPAGRVMTILPVTANRS
jgi:uncharacterized protein YbjQ (UPF0145 family)